MRRWLHPLRPRRSALRLDGLPDLFSALVDRSPHGMVVHERLELRYANPAAVRMFGYGDVGEMLGLSSVLDLIAPEDHELALNQWEHAGRSADSRAVRHLRSLRKDGSRFAASVMRGDIDWQGRSATLVVLLELPGGPFRGVSPLPHERLLQAVFETIPSHIYVKDRDGRFVVVNRAFAEFHGLTPAEFVGKTIAEVPGRHEDHVRECTAQDRLTFTSASRTEFPDRLGVNGRGEPRRLRGVKLPLRDEGGEIVGLVGVAEDVTDAKRTRDDLMDSRRLLQTVFDTIPLHLFVKDRESRYAMVNAVMADFVGIPPAEFIGKTVRDVPGRTQDHVQWAQAQDRLTFERGERTEFSDYTRIDGQGRERRFKGARLPLRNGQGDIIGLLGMVEDVTESRRAQWQLAESREWIRVVLDTIPQIVFLKDLDGRLVMANAAAARIWNRPAEELIGNRMYALSPLEEVPFEERARILRSDLRAASGETVDYEIERQLPAGKRLMRVVKAPVRDPSGAVTGLLCLVEDITDKRQAEERRVELETQLQQIQKLDLIGQLAAGIAHDFNNLLTPILGHAELLLSSRKPPDPDRAALEVILQAARRASDLTRHLLAFGRKQVLDAKVLDLNGEIAAVIPMLQRVLGAAVEIRTRTEPGLGRVRADASQLHQVLMNLVVNARDAMPEGGVVTIATANAALDGDYVSRHAGVEPGLYVQLSVSDTGTGMTRETLARAFEPFFTTKRQGHGTGLGLSIVYGIVQQHGGHVDIETAVGEGTTFHVYLPRALDLGHASAEAAEPQEAPRGSEAVLVVDDEAAVLDLMGQALADLGYHVTRASTAEEALALAPTLGARLKLVVTDVHLPKTNGIELYRRLAATYSGLKVLYVSGLPGRRATDPAPSNPRSPLLLKPFPILRFAAKVREVLDG